MTPSNLDCPTASPATQQTARTQYDVQSSVEREDTAWDSFVARVGGHHVQTSVWAEVKRFLGWRAIRVVVKDGDAIVGGAQVLLRRKRFLGTAAYVPKGPVLANGHQGVGALVVDKVREVAATEHARVLFIQPPDTSAELEPQLLQRGFRESPVSTAPTATVLIDLTLDLDVILSRMRKGMRNSVRQSERRGISVRQGTEKDVATFYQLLVATSKRRGFSPFSLEYFTHMWRTLDAHGHVAMFLSEYDGQAVSAHILVPYGDTVVAKQIGWSGDFRRCRPNEALDWETIKWAKSNGYRYYDLEGIDTDVARALINGDPFPSNNLGSPTAYKVRLGGDVTIYPQAYCLILNPAVRQLYRLVGCRFAKSQTFKKAVGRFRTS